MGSRIMHMCIAKKVIEHFNLDENRFILGSIAPDAHLPSMEFKRVSHFKLKKLDRSVGRYFDYDGFIKKYQKNIQDDFFLGYYCHLISDELWLFDFYDKYIRPFNHTEREEKLELYYRDFRRLNGKLIKHYNLKCNIEYFEDFNISEMDMNIYRKIIEELKKDFDSQDKCLEEPLELLDMEDIISFIENSVTESIDKIGGLLNNYID